jgi:hypothetical protein
MRPIPLIVAVTLATVWAQATRGEAPATRPASNPAATTKPATPSAESFAALKRGMTLDQAIATMGKPSQVDELQGGFAGLSPTEDDYLVDHRDALGKRAVWYVKRVGRTPNLNDVWFSAYFSIKDGKMVRKLSNPPAKK